MVTIVLATYEGAAYIKEQLDSIKRQTDPNWQLLVRDDGSKDKTWEYLQQFSNEVTQSVDLLENQPPTGSAKSNFACLIEDALIKEAEYVMFCDQDDVWFDNKIEMTLAAMKELEEKNGSETPLLVHGDLELVDENMKVIGDSMFSISNIRPNSTLAQLLVQNNVTGCTMMINHSMLKGIAPFIKRKEVIMHDYFAALYGAVFGERQVLLRSLLKYRQHGNNSVGAKNSKNLGYLWKRLCQGKEEYKEEMEESRKQIGCFLDCYKIELDQPKMEAKRKIMEEYASLGNASSWHRIQFYRRNKCWKKGSIRKIMQILWG